MRCTKEGMPEIRVDRGAEEDEHGGENGRGEQK